MKEIPEDKGLGEKLLAIAVKNKLLVANFSDNISQALLWTHTNWVLIGRVRKQILGLMLFERVGTVSMRVVLELLRKGFAPTVATDIKASIQTICHYSENREIVSQ